jgi:hypothetical protein
MPSPTDPLPPDVLDALARGNKIEAIKLLRGHTGLGLKEAKDAVEASGVVATGRKLSPGEVPRSSPAGWWLSALAIAAVAAYYFLRGPG